MMNKGCIAGILCALISISSAGATFTAPVDIPEARELCDNADLRPIEGLWTFPQDDVTVLIYRSASKGGYNIYVVEAADCLLKPGMKIGEALSTADPNKFTLRMFTRMKKGIPEFPQDVTATLSETKESLTFKKPSFKIRINPTRLLPYFWRFISVSVKTGEPAPEGMIKTYPSYDGNGSSRREPRYL